MPAGLTYGVPGSGTYSQTLANFDAIMATIPDNTINQITARNIRDIQFTIYEIMQSSIAANLQQVLSVGNTASLSMTVGGLQVTGTSSFTKNIQIYSTISDSTGSTGSIGYVLASINGGVGWTTSLTSVPGLQQVTNVGNSTSQTLTVNNNLFANDLFISNSSTFNGFMAINSTIKDKTGITGPMGYILSATNGGVLWIPNNSNGGGGGTLSLQQVTTTGNTTTANVEVGGLQVDGTASITKNLRLYSTLTDITGKTGSQGQVISATNGGIIWINDTGGSIGGISATPSLGQVLTAGNTSSLPIIIDYHTGGYVRVYDSTNATDYTVMYGGSLFVQAGSNLFDIQPGSSYINFTSNSLHYSSINFPASSISVDHNYNLPLISGTFAMISDIPTGLTSSIGPKTIHMTNSSYIIAITDKQSLVGISASLSSTVTIPPISAASFSVGDTIDIVQYGPGVVSISASSGVTLNSAYGYTTLATQYAAATLTNMATNVWLLVGNLIP